MGPVEHGADGGCDDLAVTPGPLPRKVRVLLGADRYELVHAVAAEDLATHPAVVAAAGKGEGRLRRRSSLRVLVPGTHLSLILTLISASDRDRG